MGEGREGGWGGHTSTLTPCSSPEWGMGPSEPKESWKLVYSPPILAFGMNSFMEELASSLPLHPASHPFPPHRFHMQG